MILTALLHPPLDMWEGIVFMMLGPAWGIIALIVTIPLEALFLCLLLNQSIVRSVCISAMMNFFSSLCGAAIIFFSAFIMDLPFVYIPLFFLGTLLIEYPFMFAFLQPAASLNRIVLVGLLVNIISHVVIIGVCSLFSGFSFLF